MTIAPTAKHPRRAVLAARVLSLALLLSVVFPASIPCVRAAAASESVPEIWRHLVDRLVADGLGRVYVDALFSRSSLAFDPDVMARKMNALLRTRLEPREPEHTREGPGVYTRYLGPFLLAGALEYKREHAAMLADVAERYAVPENIMVALLLVETKLGTYIGRHRAMENLASMARADDPALFADRLDYHDLSAADQAWLVKRTAQKADWAYRELEALVRYAKAGGHDPLVIPSSVYGAIGLCQFMPTNALAYGRDGDGDGRVDLFDHDDAVHSMAHFLARHGWKPGLSRKAQEKVIYRYNHNWTYTRTIFAVAESLDKAESVIGQ